MRTPLRGIACGICTVQCYKIPLIFQETFIEAFKTSFENLNTRKVDIGNKQWKNIKF